MLVGHFTHDFSNQVLTRLEKFIECDGLINHALETAPVFGGNVEPRGRKNLRHRAIVAEDVDDECLAQAVVDSLMCEQIPHIEQIAWMLSV